MKFGIKRKHSLSNRYMIEEWISLKKKRMVGFLLDNNNELYINADELSFSYCLSEECSHIRDEVIIALIEDLNLKLGLESVKIVRVLATEKRIMGGYKLNDMFSGVYINNLDPIICELFFEKVEQLLKSENDLSSLLLDLTLKLGKIILPENEIIQKNKIYAIDLQFNVICNSKYLFNFFLGVEEIMLVKEDQLMNVEDNIGVHLSPEIEELSIDLDVVLGTIQMPISELKELLVGDFINIESLSFLTVVIRYKNKKMAIGELVYNEKDKLSIEINEVF